MTLPEPEGLDPPRRKKCQCGRGALGYSDRCGPCWRLLRQQARLATGEVIDRPRCACGKPVLGYSARCGGCWRWRRSSETTGAAGGRRPPASPVDAIPASAVITFPAPIYVRRRDRLVLVAPLWRCRRCGRHWQALQRPEQCGYCAALAEGSLVPRAARAHAVHLTEGQRLIQIDATHYTLLVGGLLASGEMDRITLGPLRRRAR